MFRKLFPAVRRPGGEETRPDPWTAMDRFWQSALGPQPFGPGVTPVMDVSETEAEVLVQAELPGMEARDIQLTLEQGVLTIRGEKKREEEKKGEGFHRVERSYGSFSRSVHLPTACLGDKIQAEYRNGVLTVRIPKDSARCARRIVIEE